MGNVTDAEASRSFDKRPGSARAAQPKKSAIRRCRARWLRASNAFQARSDPLLLAGTTVRSFVLARSSCTLMRTTATCSRPPSRAQFRLVHTIANWGRLASDLRFETAPIERLHFFPRKMTGVSLEVILPGSWVMIIICEHFRTPSGLPGCYPIVSTGTSNQKNNSMTPKPLVLTPLVAWLSRTVSRDNRQTAVAAYLWCEALHV